MAIPVAYHKAVEAHAIFQHISQQIFVTVHLNTIP